jgi:hypothetical protein
MKWYGKFILLLFVSACAASAADNAIDLTKTEDVRPRQPRTTCRTLEHGVPSGLDAESVAQWAKRELNRSDAMIGYCQSSIGRLKDHIRGIINVD